MSDIKLFQISSNAASVIEGQSVAVEKSLQTLIEKYLDAFLGVRFLASEYLTGKTHGGRIDTLGIDENVHPQNGKIVVFVKADWDRVRLEDGFTRDMRNVGHYGTGDLEITISSDDDLERAKPLMLKSYEEN